MRKRQKPKLSSLDRLPVACPLALLPHTAAGACDVQARSAAQFVRGIVQPGPWPAEPTVTPSEPAIKGVAQRDLQVADGLPERGGDGRVQASTPDCRREVPFAVSEISKLSRSALKRRSRSAGKICCVELAIGDRARHHHEPGFGWSFESPGLTGGGDAYDQAHAEDAARFALVCAAEEQGNPAPTDSSSSSTTCPSASPPRRSGEVGQRLLAGSAVAGGLMSLATFRPGVLPAFQSPTNDRANSIISAVASRASATLAWGTKAAA